MSDGIDPRGCVFAALFGIIIWSAIIVLIWRAVG